MKRGGGIRGGGRGGSGSGRGNWIPRPRGRGSSRSAGTSSSHLHGHIGDDRQIDSDSLDNKNANFHSPSQIWQPKSPVINSEKSGHETAFSTHIVGAPQHANNSPESSVTSKTEELPSLLALHSVCKGKDTSSTYTESVSQDRHLDGRRFQFGGQTSDGEGAQPSPVIPVGNRNMEQSEQSTRDAPFDICLTKVGTPIMLKPSLYAKNREKRNETKRSMEGEKSLVLKSGMVLLKDYLSFADQVKIVKKCRDLGLGSGGFYQPGYRDGGELHLKMMCLGKNWDPETSKYDDYRPIDGAKPPFIPNEFNQLVKRALQDSHAVIRKEIKSSRVEDILPFMSADICIVNFYTATGRLGLHKDRDESAESLKKGLPVVSFSIGDSADFQYGDENDVTKADKIKLESGDVLIFGGKSRHVYHGVTAILPKSAPTALLEETSLRPGRLNLTFRQY